MKKIILAASVIGFLAMATPAFADQCGDVKLNHGAIINVDPITFATTTTPALNNIACSNGPVNMVMPWGDEAVMPKVQAGQFIIDEYGFKIWTPDISFGAGWVDLTHTDYYRNQMRVLVSQLQTKEQINQFPQFQGWVGK